MIGIVIVAHGRLAESLVEAAEMIVGSSTQMKACSFGQESSVDTLRKMVKTSIKEVDTGDGVIILTDMFGGTPSNISLSFLEDAKIEVVTGVNLPMVINALTKREGKNIRELVFLLKDSGCKNIYIASEVLATNLKKS